MSLHDVLVKMFGAEPNQIVFTSMDNLDITTNLKPLLMLAGGEWGKLVIDLEARIAERKTYKNPGADARLKE